ncbi:glycosyltransferase family 2 protein [Pseudomonas inefficax]|uniref:glycosyltransferase family 2 protein n=1 Tax=Pseudomonas inefficax TaxID=2078786 RepID=UPI0040469B0E
MYGTVQVNDQDTSASGQRVGAIVVLYQPELSMLRRVIESLVGQVERIYVMDNTPDGRRDDYDGLADIASVFYCPLHDNLGIATAHNRGIELARQEGMTHVLLMDQDSQLAPNTVEHLLQHETRLLNSSVNVAAIGPVFVDEKTGDAAPAISPGRWGSKKVKIDLNSPTPVKSTYIIASGSLIRVSVLETVGGMQDDLFIDWVDIEWGERAALAGYECYLVPSVKMKHSIGDEFVSVLGRRVTLHSDFRNYFIVRNAAFLALWSALSGPTRFQLMTKLPYYIVCYSWFSSKRAYALRLLLLALKDGVMKRMGKGRFQ